MKRLYLFLIQPLDLNHGIAACHEITTHSLDLIAQIKWKYGLHQMQRVPAKNALNLTCFMFNGRTREARIDSIFFLSGHMS